MTLEDLISMTTSGNLSYFCCENIALLLHEMLHFDCRRIAVLSRQYLNFVSILRGFILVLSRFYLGFIAILQLYCNNRAILRHLKCNESAIIGHLKRNQCAILRHLKFNQSAIMLFYAIFRQSCSNNSARMHSPLHYYYPLANSSFK